MSFVNSSRTKAVALTVLCTLNVIATSVPIPQRPLEP